MTISLLLHTDLKLLSTLPLSQADFSQISQPSLTLLISLSVSAGCKTKWDHIGCWLRAEVGQVVNISCSEVFQHFSSNQGRPPPLSEQTQRKIAHFLPANHQTNVGVPLHARAPVLCDKYVVRYCIICKLDQSHSDERAMWIIHVCLLSFWQPWILSEISSAEFRCHSLTHCQTFYRTLMSRGKDQCS